MKQIPKIIHYVWVGEKEKPELVLKCIESWKRFLPDYEIIEWNNDSLKNIKNQYVEEAFRNKKWAFVSDYLRLYALYHQGGIYLDTDCEITQNIDEFLDLDFFSCYEYFDSRAELFPISALLGAKANNSIIFDLLKEYDNLRFETENGLDLTTNTVRISNYFSKKFNFNPPYNGEKIHLESKSIIFPYTFFCKKEDGIVNYAIHHFNGSWLPTYQRRDKIRIGKNYILSRFKKERNREDNDYPINQNEEILFNIKFSKKKLFCLIKKK
ncbi:glycosyltransferase family 32 protein [Frederiksenia canicola]|uniref:Glycosyl transferase-like sugar-binding protein n=1 Tax=Frederiksenia canicola TaxID=123824 RepID=A0AAE7C2U4_9PAST|nr:glycosyltransferase [Frederiksenia canicola]QIM65043.1 hypothetical protein A4G17_06145 [Frederiksenia canicola]RPE96544.1 glycosyl transferase-like sugar-binding protein [Frederiksenia canicola]